MIINGKTYVLVEQQYVNDELEKALNLAQESDNLDVIAVLYPLQNYVMDIKINMASKRPNNLHKQELLQILVSEYGYTPEEVNHAKPRQLIEMYINASQLNIDVDAIIELINGAYNIDLDEHYKL